MQTQIAVLKYYAMVFKVRKAQMRLFEEKRCRQPCHIFLSLVLFCTKSLVTNNHLTYYNIVYEPIREGGAEPQ